MKILGIECSAVAASAAIFEDGKPIAHSFVNVKLTHSQTLMPMIDTVLKNSITSLDDIGYIAVAAGPGSFTGVRIGISAVKGIAAPRNIPCIPVSTLEGMAHMFTDRDCIVCPVMDARCNQFYNAIFEVKNGEIKRLCPDRALMSEELKAELQNMQSHNSLPIIITGDGSEIFRKEVEDIAKIAPCHLLQQNAVGVCLAARQENAVSPAELLPVYLRLPQAERELKAKQSN